MTKTGRRRPTLDDVADAVGVSRATVSNAYNRPDQLSASLREHVLRAAKDLGYPGPNPTARSLATSRTGAIAFMLDTSLSSAFSDPALTITLDALAKAVDPHGHALLLMPGGPQGGPPTERILAAQADIAVAYSLADGSPALESVRDRGLPLVVIDEPLVPGSARIGCQDRLGASLAARHLLSLGHRRFGIFSMQCGHSAPRGGELTPEAARASRFHVTRERLAGYLGTLEDAGIPATDVAIWEASGISAEDAMTSAFGLLDRSPRPTALVCMSDQLALAAIAVARQLGVDVPGELSVVGFDDTPTARWCEPPLTTVRQDLAAKGRIAGELVLQLLDGGPTPEPAEVPVELVLRASTARA